MSENPKTGNSTFPHFKRLPTSPIFGKRHPVNPSLRNRSTPSTGILRCQMLFKTISSSQNLVAPPLALSFSSGQAPKLPGLGVSSSQPTGVQRARKREGGMGNIREIVTLEKFLPIITSWFRTRTPALRGLSSGAGCIGPRMIENHTINENRGSAGSGGKFGPVVSQPRPAAGGVFG